jgi:hypothetical protein
LLAQRHVSVGIDVDQLEADQLLEQRSRTVVGRDVAHQLVERRLAVARVAREQARCAAPVAETALGDPDRVHRGGVRTDSFQLHRLRFPFREPPDLLAVQAREEGHARAGRLAAGTEVLARGQHVDALENLGGGLVGDPAGDQQPHERHQHARERFEHPVRRTVFGRAWRHGLIFIPGRVILTSRDFFPQ